MVRSESCRAIRACGVSLLFASAMLSGPSAFGDDDAPAAPKSDFALTIYSSADPATFDPQEYARQRLAGSALPMPGYGVVREIRRINLEAGVGVARFTDVASGIDPTTVSFKSVTAPGSTAVLEQSYEYDLVSPDKLLEKYIGRDVIVNRRQPPLADDKTHQPETIQGKLLSYDGSTFVLQSENKRLPVQMIPRSADITEIKLFDLNTGLITRPTLVWKVSAEKAGPHDARVSYQTDGLTWRADYSFVVNATDTKADVSSWVTVLNESGASYSEARLKLVAGDLHRLKRPNEIEERMKSVRFEGAAAAEPRFTEKALFEYHLYTLTRPTTLLNNSVKQLELFPTRTDVPVTKRYVYYGLASEMPRPVNSSPLTDAQLGLVSNKQVDTYLEVTNSEKDHLGIPLPAGRVRLYKADEADGLHEFVGEDVIAHTPKDEKVLLRAGTAFDITGERKQTAFHVDEAGKVMTETIVVTLRNHKKQAVPVLIKENLYRWANWEITNSSEKYEKQDYRTIHFPVTVPADGEKKVGYDLKYSW